MNLYAEIQMMLSGISPVYRDTIVHRLQFKLEQPYGLPPTLFYGVSMHVQTRRLAVCTYKQHEEYWTEVSESDNQLLKVIWQQLRLNLYNPSKSTK